MDPKVTIVSDRLPPDSPLALALAAVRQDLLRFEQQTLPRHTLRVGDLLRTAQGLVLVTKLERDEDGAVLLHYATVERQEPLPF